MRLTDRQTDRQMRQAIHSIIDPLDYNTAHSSVTVIINRAGLNEYLLKPENYCAPLPVGEGFWVILLYDCC